MSTRKLNVAQAAKEAGQEYACLTTEEKEVCHLGFYTDVTILLMLPSVALQAAVSGHEGGAGA